MVSIMKCQLIQGNIITSRQLSDETDRIWWHNHLKDTTREENNEKGWYFRFDDDNKIHPLDHLNLNGTVEHLQSHIQQRR